MTGAARSLTTGLFLAAVGWLAAQPAAAQIHSWSRDLPGPRRFQVLRALGSEAALDRETGLVWQIVPQSLRTNEKKDLFGATLACLEATTGGKRGWRLPSAEEMLTLSDPAIPAAPTLPAGHPFELTAAAATAQFVTASARFAPNEGIWGTLFVDYRPGPSVIEPLQLDEQGEFWCVRGGSTQLNTGPNAP